MSKLNKYNLRSRNITNNDKTIESNQETTPKKVNNKVNKSVKLKKENPNKKMSEIVKNLNIDDTFTKPQPKPKTFSKVKDNIPLLEDYNFMADILMLPEDKNGYKYCLAVCDLANNDFDIEPMKNKDPDTVLKAFKTMIETRKFIGKPYASIRTDGGGEFKGAFDTYLYHQNILHKTGLPNRHTQSGNIEALNRQLAYLFMNYLNKKEEETGESYHNWTDIESEVRKQLNEYRKLKLPTDIYKYNYPLPNLEKPPKFKVGDIVYRLLDRPLNALGHKESGNFRTGDYRWDKKTPHKILKILYYAGEFPYRYIISDIPNASFTEAQLKLGLPDDTVEKYIINSIIGHSRINKQMHYRVWFRGELKKNALYYPRTELMKDIPDVIEKYDKENKVKLINGN